MVHVPICHIKYLSIEFNLRQNFCSYEAQSDFVAAQLSQRIITEALKGHRVVWKIEIYYLIRMT